MLFTFFLSFIVILPAVIQIYDRLVSVNNSREHIFSASKILHHPAIWSCVIFGFICGISYLIVSIFHFIYLKKLGGNHNANSANTLTSGFQVSLFFKFANVITLSILLTAIILVIGVFLLFFGK
jgi:hypothetical protein